MKYLPFRKREIVTHILSNFTTKPTLKKTTSLSTTNPKTKNLGGSFNRYQLNRFWGNFNEDLYNRICEIKMQEI